MAELTTYAQARRKLTELLQRPEGMLTDDEQETMVMCAARVIEEHICEIAEYDLVDARDGITALTNEMNKHIVTICQRGRFDDA